MPVYPSSQMYNPQSGDNPIISGLKSVGRALGWNDPNAVMGVGVPMGAPTSLAGEATAAAVPTMETVGQEALPQVNPSANDVEGLVNGMKARLNQVPTAANKYVMPTSASTSAEGGNSTFDMINPATQSKMEEMYQQANPVFKQLQQQGVFGTPEGRNIWLGGSSTQPSPSTMQQNYMNQRNQKVLAGLKNQ